MSSSPSKTTTATAMKSSPKHRLSSHSRAGSRASSPSRRPHSPFPSTLRSSPSAISLKAAPTAASSATAPEMTNVSTRIPNPSTSILIPGTSPDTHEHPARESAVASSASSIIGVSLSAGDPYLMREDDAISQMTHEDDSRSSSEDDDDDTGTETGSHRLTMDMGISRQGDEDGGENVMGMIEDPMVEGEARRSLRDQLRRTLTREREMGADIDIDAEPLPIPLTEKGKEPEIIQELKRDQSLGENTTPRQYFVLTEAGKPVYVSEDAPIGKDEDALSSTMGLVQALMSIFLDEGDKLRCINAGRMRITFLQRSPLYLFCVSNWGEPESVTRQQLEYIHLQILSVLTGDHIRRIFEKRSNFDLRRHLSGAEVFLHSLILRMQYDLAISMSSLLCLPLEAGLRRKIGSILVPAKMKDILYVLLIVDGRVVTIVRPKKHSVHPADLHILLNTVQAPAITNSPATWLPICLPRFNNNGFLYAYVTFPQQDKAGRTSTPVPTPTVATPNESNDEEEDIKETVTDDSTPSELNDDNTSTATEASIQKTDTCLVCVSGGGGSELEVIRTWCDSVTSTLNSSGALEALNRSVQNGSTEYDVSVLGIPGLLHFVYKSRPHVQVTHPTWGDEYNDETARRRLITLYQIIHDNIHGKSGQKDLLKLQYIRSEHEAVMGWITTPFELYICTTSSLPKSAVVNAANAVMRWVKKEESTLFLRDAPVF